MWQWEFEVLGKELLDVLTLNVISLFKLNNLQDVDVSKSGSVSGSKVLVHLLDGSDSGDITVFLVHVVSAGSGLVSDPDTNVLHLGWVWLRDNVKSNNFTRSLLDLVKLLQKVPVTRLSNNIVRSKNSHTVEFWLRDSVGRETTANNLIFVQTGH